MKTIIRTDAGTLECPILKNNPELQRCKFVLCFYSNRPEKLFNYDYSRESLELMPICTVPDWVELMFLNAIMEKDRFRIVTPMEANKVFRLYQHSPNNNPGEAVREILEILDKPLYAVVDTDYGTIAEIHTDKETAKLYARNGNEDAERERYEVRNIRNGVDAN